MDVSAAVTSCRSFLIIAVPSNSPCCRRKGAISWCAATIRVSRKATNVIDALSDLFFLRGIPGHTRTDNGPSAVCLTRSIERSRKQPLDLKFGGSRQFLPGIGVRITERYCVVYQTIRSGPPDQVRLHRS
ncbi:hypothetical protein CU102_25180 [Phyllobacterium brassicacearum]|uniref:Uncharacterized protein n=1 Tax=Phyllobacterium brassicacearum TaxID=314235 RepID=A0A2P7B863_9HYPH|nr:hypothetical protein CU102_25180 [Phyllobacterium brassicacearum]